MSANRPDAGFSEQLLELYKDSNEGGGTNSPLYQFAGGEFSTENLDFLIAVNELNRPNIAIEEKRKKMQDIYKIFIQADAEQQVNLPDDIREKIRNVLEEYERDPDSSAARQKLNFALQEAVKEIQSLVKRDTFKRFSDQKIVKQNSLQVNQPTEKTKKLGIFAPLYVAKAVGIFKNRLRLKNQKKNNVDPEQESKQITRPRRQ